MEESELSARKILIELGIPRSTFYKWYRRYLEGGPDGLIARNPQTKRFWNKIPREVADLVVEKAKLEEDVFSKHRQNTDNLQNHSNTNQSLSL